ncbi:MAG: S8 family serine peptidase [Ignavibacteriaceae bacterium]|nr:S8 family serine peptidase [Ignavibacteriaceae bacterium]
MKRLLLLCIVFFSHTFYSQTPCLECPENGLSQNGDNVIRLDPVLSSSQFVPGVVLVKFKDETAIRLGKSQGVVTTGYFSVDLILAQFAVTSAERIFPTEQRRLEKTIVKTFSGEELEIPSLHNIYQLALADTFGNIMGLIEALKADDNVVYAEPNYIFSIIESEPLSPELTEAEMIKWVEENPLPATSVPASPKAITPNDPLYSQQWGIPAAQIDAVWDSTTGDTTQIIAILDTGVDWLHPDLKNKIWTNPNEIPDNGIDDDGNGYIDDIQGWDFVDWDNNPRDLNGHGTHVAGIAAAEANNELGISGTSWGAKILPIQILSRNGQGDGATISQGIYYASNMGASVINMSFGGYLYSLTMASALQYALLTSDLVGAAGNDRKSIYEVDVLGRPLVFYPAGLPYVFGVQVTADFSNFDPDGPVFSKYSSEVNYELLSYGDGIISTFPAGKYKVYSGTSMGAPLISGMISLYNSVKLISDRESRWSDFIHISKPVNLFRTINNSDKPPVYDLRSFVLSDSLPGNDLDGQADAGETITISTRIRNTFGYADSTFIKIQLSEIDKYYFSEHIIFENDSAFLGSIGSFRERENILDPFRIYLKPSFPNEDNVQFEVLIWNKGDVDTTRQVFEIAIYNGTELSGILSGEIVLTPDRLWLINNSTRLTSGSTMKILPGTHLIINGSFDNRGFIEAIGTADSLITIENNANINASISKFVVYNLNGSDLNGGYFENCIINNSGRNYGRFYKCKFTNLKDVVGKLVECQIDGMNPRSEAIHIDTLINSIVKNSIYTGNYTKYIEQCLFLNNFYDNWGHGPTFSQNPTLEYNIFQGITNWIVYFYPNAPYAWINSRILDLNQANVGSYKSNVFITRRDMKFMNIFQSSGEDDVLNLPGQYFGTTKLNKIKNNIIDFEDNASLPLINIDPMIVPSDSVRGFVWKVLVNGKDAQDEYLEPVGVGPQRFDVYFNRAMNPEFPPSVSFGGLDPFTSNSVRDSGSWSADNKVWTVYHTIKLYTGDGINRIRVSNARDLNDSEIPVEDQRFEILISAAGSASADFMATAGLGKVNLEWSNIDLSSVPDLLGYNMYRLEHINDTTLTEPVLINNSLITDTIYTDFEVIPNKKYYYYYRVVRTDFSESDSSRVVSSIPLTASHGDANGDLSVNVLDITTMVSFLLNQNPQPFIFAAADVNQDNLVNVLDIVGTVNIIMGGINKEHLTGTPVLALDGRGAWLSGGSPVAGMQFMLTGKDLKDAHVVPGPLTEGMELGWSVTEDTLRVVIYNFKRNTISSDEKGLLFRISKGELKKLESVLASNAAGEQLEVKFSNDGFLVPEEYILYQNYPNPFNPVTVIKYGIPEQSDIEAEIFNILGEKVWEYRVIGQKAGYYELQWKSENMNRRPVASGVYIFRLKAGKFISHKKMMLLR